MGGFDRKRMEACSRAHCPENLLIELQRQEKHLRTGAQRSSKSTLFPTIENSHSYIHSSSLEFGKDEERIPTLAPHGKSNCSYSGEIVMPLIDP